MRRRGAVLYLKRFNVCPVFEVSSDSESVFPASKHVILIRETGETYYCVSTENLLQGMARIGRRCIPVGCVNGGCGVCKVVIIKGDVRKCGSVSRAHISEREELQGIVLACRAMPMSAIELEVIGKIKKAIW